MKEQYREEMPSLDPEVIFTCIILTVVYELRSHAIPLILLGLLFEAHE